MFNIILVNLKKMLKKNVTHFKNIILGLILKSKKQNLFKINNIKFKDVDWKKKWKKQKKTLFVVTHDYCFVDALVIYMIGLKCRNLKNTKHVVRKNFVKEYSKILPGARFIEANKNTKNEMIKTLKNNNNVIIFYSRRHLKYLNIDDIVKEVDIEIIPVKITSKTILPISHNKDGVLENIDIMLNNKFEVEFGNKIKYNKSFSKADFISIIKEILYPDNGYFNEQDIFVKL